MIYIFVDESGSFECIEKEKQNKEVVGGIILKEINNENSFNELHKKVENEFIKAGGKDFFNKIHGKERKGKIQNKVLIDIFRNKSCGDNIIPFYIRREKLTKVVNSNITDDETLSMLYLNMMSRVISNLLIYRSDVLDNDNEVIINVANRSIPEKKLEQNNLKTFEEFSIVKNNGEYKVNSAEFLISSLNSELSLCNYINNKINITVKSDTIAYKKDKIDGLNIFYQLSDFVCNNACLNVLKDLNEIVFAYDDIDEAYRNIYRSYKNGNLYNFINLKIYFDKQFADSCYKKGYNSFLNELDYKAIISSDTITDFIEKSKLIISSKNYNRKEMKAKLDFIDEYIDKYNIDSRTMLEYYLLKMRVYNHLGNYTGNKSVYSKINLIENNINSLNTISLKLSAMNLYAVSLSNGFLFKDALDVINKIIVNQKFIEDMYSEVSTALDVSNNKSCVTEDVFMGKLLSSKGQYESFIDDKNAEKSFLSALDYYGSNEKEKNQTISYLIHFYAYFKIIPEFKIQSIINSYFNFNNFDEGINYFNSIPIENLTVTSLSFKLFAFIKYLDVYEKMGENIEINKLEAIEKKILKLGDILEHPYELICFNLSRKTCSKDLKRKLIEKAISICVTNDSDFTLRVIGAMIELNSYKSKKNLKHFLDIFKDEGITVETKNYFEIERLNEMNNVDKSLEIINEKFTYMYK